jgi:uncharacterized protein YdiU (UPF0061 family)
MPLIGDSDVALAALEPYKQEFPDALLGLMRAKLGLTRPEPGDRERVDDLLRLMAAQRVDLSICFRRLCSFDSSPEARNEALRDLFTDRDAFDGWARGYAAQLRAQAGDDARRAAAMRRVNPKIVLRNHLAEAAIRQAQQGDFSEIERLAKALQRPFDELPEHEAYAGFPPDWAQHQEVSCSS